MQLHLENAALRFSVDTYGCRISRFETAAGKAILQGCSTSPRLLTPDECGGFPLLPIANRVTHDSYTLGREIVSLPLTAPDGREYLHGRSWLSEWEASKLTQDTLRLTFKAPLDESGYAYTAHVDFRLTESTLKIELTLHCEGERRLYGIGFHPYFALEDGCTLTLPVTGYFPEHFAALPQENIPAPFDYTEPKPITPVYVNHCYAGFHALTLRHPGGLAVTLESDNLPYLMMYHVPGRPFIALEPQSHVVDACHLPGRGGLIYLDRHFPTLRGALTLTVNAEA